MPNQFSEKDIYRVLSANNIDPVETQKIKRQLHALRNQQEQDAKQAEINRVKSNTRKDEVPARPLYDGRIYENGPFTLMDNEVWSTVVSGGSPLMQWLPTSTMKARKVSVAHMDWIAPEGYDGSETYAEFLNGISIGECGYGPSTSWSGFSYSVEGGSFSWTTSSMRPYEDARGSLPYYEDQPLMAVRGNNLGMNVIQSDAEWAIARTLHAMEVHLDYVLKHGDRSNSEMEWDGIDQIVRPGYVASRIHGTGIPTWADPIWVNGIAISSIAELARNLRVMIRLLRKRARDRNWSIAPGDIAIVMSSVMWDNLAEYLAMGAMYRYENTFNFSGDMSFRDFKEEYRNVLANGVDVDGQFVQVLPDTSLGAGTQVDTGGGTVDGVTSDIYILTKRVNGNVVWTQEYLDWNDLSYPSILEDTINIQGGVVRTGWVTEANKCYYYYSEMVGRLVCKMLPMQARISNATIPILDALENETPNFYSADYYPAAVQGTQMGAGTAVLNPV